MNPADMAVQLPKGAPSIDADPPGPIRCACGNEWPWTWHKPRVNGRVYSGRWAAPRVNPCKLCEIAPEILAERQLRGRILGAGIPEPLVCHALRRDLITEQTVGESIEDFRARVFQLRRKAPVLGVALDQVSAYRALVQWKPPQWLVLHGPPGTGKTTLLAALARRLLHQPPERRETREGRPVVVRAVRHAVEYHRLDELVARERAKLKGLDGAPTVDVAKVGVSREQDGEAWVSSYDPRSVLMLDELGLSPTPHWSEVLLVERVINYRADNGLCTVVVSNRDLDELVGPGCIYGWRVGDRLKGALAVALTGDSWRTP